MTSLIKHKGGSKVVAAICTLVLLFTYFAVYPVMRPQAAQAAAFSLRIEGVSSTLCSAPVAFDPGDQSGSLYKILTRFLTQKGIAYTSSNAWGSDYISSIAGERAGQYGAYSGWLFAVNGSLASTGMADYKPRANDNIVVYYGDFSTHLPQVTLSPEYPVAGQNVTISVNTTFDDWSAGSPVSKTEGVQNADIVFDGAAYHTDSHGNATIRLPDTPGSYTLSVSKDTAGACPSIVRAGAIAITVYAPGSAPQQGDASILSLPVTYTPSMSTATVASASSTHYNGVGVTIGAGTTVTGASGWDGIIHMPQLLNKSSVSVPAGFANMAVKVGSSASLRFSKPVTITLPGQAGRRACYFDADNVFHAIAKRDGAPSAAELAALTGETCYDQGGDLVIVTTHFTTFAAYSDIPTVSDADVKAAVKGAASYLSGDLSDWSTFALARAGYPLQQQAVDSLSQSIAGTGSFGNPNTLSREILAVRAAGKDPQNFAGHNLVSMLADFTGIDKTGLNGAAFGLIALRSGGYTLPASPANTADSLKALLLSYQNADGSFALDKSLAGDPDMTAIAVTALSRLQDSSPSVQSAVNKAVSWLSEHQSANGGYYPATGVSSPIQASESVSQVIIALSGAGIDPATDLRFIKNGKSPLDNLMSYRLPDGGFAHEAGDTQSNITSTQQALMALTAYSRYQAGQPALYDLKQAHAAITPVTNPDTGTPGSLPEALVFTGMAAAALAVAKRINKKKR